MLTIFGTPHRNGGFCDGVTPPRLPHHRRHASSAALSLPQILLAPRHSAGIGHSHKAIINIYLPGGPPHLDMWDLKPDAPAEIRGEFKPISTNVPGIEICEHFPRIAADDGQVRHHPLAGRLRTATTTPTSA